jgi:hypothetical protein
LNEGLRVNVSSNKTIGKNNKLIMSESLMEHIAEEGVENGKSWISERKPEL